VADRIHYFFPELFMGILNELPQIGNLADLAFVLFTQVQHLVHEFLIRELPFCTFFTVFVRKEEVSNIDEGQGVHADLLEKMTSALIL
jgi:hypothetical protein